MRVCHTEERDREIRRTQHLLSVLCLFFCEEDGKEQEL
jgi:hypothetical protein